MNITSLKLNPLMIAKIEKLEQQLSAALLWQKAVEHELVVAGVWNKSHENNSKKAVKDVIDWYVQVARDAAQAQSARRLEGLCKCGIEKDQLQQQLEHWKEKWEQQATEVEKLRLATRRGKQET